MTDDFITEAEARRLEKEADALLREDAKAKGFIKPRGKYGFGKYAKEAGILTQHDIVTIRKHEFASDFDRLDTGDDEEPAHL